MVDCFWTVIRWGWAAGVGSAGNHGADFILLVRIHAIAVRTNGVLAVPVRTLFGYERALLLVVLCLTKVIEPFAGRGHVELKRLKIRCKAR